MSKLLLMTAGLIMYAIAIIIGTLSRTTSYESLLMYFSIIIISISSFIISKILLDKNG